MAVWVRLRIEAVKGGGAPAVLEANALINTGYRADVGDLSVPSGAAERLGLWPTPPGDAVHAKVEGYGGKETEIVGIRECLRVGVLTEDRKRPFVLSACTIAAGDSEILVSDALTGELGIVVLDARRGLWCFRDELGKKERFSEADQDW